MRKPICILIATLLLVFGLAACTDKTPPPADTPPPAADTTPPPADTTPTNAGSQVLVAYFSCTDTTEKIAEYVVEKTGGARYEIQPKIPYTEDDLKY